MGAEESHDSTSLHTSEPLNSAAYDLFSLPPFLPFIPVSIVVVISHVKKRGTSGIEAVPLFAQLTLKAASFLLISVHAVQLHLASHRLPADFVSLFSCGIAFPSLTRSSTQFFSEYRVGVIFVNFLRVARSSYCGRRTSLPLPSPSRNSKI